MTQNLISLDLSAEDVAEFDAALAVIEKFVAPLLSLTAEEARSLSKMDCKAGAYGSKTPISWRAESRRRAIADEISSPDTTVVGVERPS